MVLEPVLKTAIVLKHLDWNQPHGPGAEQRQRPPAYLRVLLHLSHQFLQSNRKRASHKHGSVTDTCCSKLGTATRRRRCESENKINNLSPIK